MVATREPWPALPLAEWHQTRDTLQLWTQIIGKVRMVNAPLLNHWWNVPLYVGATGLTTSLTPHPSGDAFQVDFDLSSHRLEIVTVSGSRRSMPLQSGPVADFYDQVMQILTQLGLATTIWPVPVEIEGAIPFAGDQVHTEYDPEQAHRFWLALVQMVRVFEQFRGRFWGSRVPYISSGADFSGFVLNGPSTSPSEYGLPLSLPWEPGARYPPPVAS